MIIQTSEGILLLKFEYEFTVKAKEIGAKTARVYNKIARGTTLESIHSHLLYQLKKEIIQVIDIKYRGVCGYYFLSSLSSYAALEQKCSDELLIKIKAKFSADPYHIP